MRRLRHLVPHGAMQTTRRSSWRRLCNHMLSFVEGTGSYHMTPVPGQACS